MKLTCDLCGKPTTDEDLLCCACRKDIDAKVDAISDTDTLPCMRCGTETTRGDVLCLECFTAERWAETFASKTTSDEYEKHGDWMAEQVRNAKNSPPYEAPF
jgi:predicted amidophosphoribosyltransferase